MAVNNYTLGRGRISFSRFIAGGQVPEGYRYIGNTPEFSMSIEEETLDHYSSESGVREKDESVPLEVNRTGSMSCDNISKENVALFFFGTAATLTVAASAGLSDDTLVVKKDRSYQIGRTSSKPDGVRGISNVVVQNAAETVTYTDVVDYTVDLDRGTITITAASTIADDENIHVDYDQEAITMDQIVSGSQPVEGSIWLHEDNPVGVNRDVVLPWCKISPNGDLSFKGDDWRVIPFSIEILKPTDSEAIYVNGQPAYT